MSGLINLFSRDIFSLDADGGSDVLGRVYEYFITNFASTEGTRGGEFFTPRSIVRLLVAMMEPKAGKVFDPACGSGGMFVQAGRCCPGAGAPPASRPSALAARASSVGAKSATPPWACSYRSMPHATTGLKDTTPA